MKTKRQIIFERAEIYAKKNLQLINVEMGDYEGSQKCHHVARHRLETGECSKLAVVLSFVPKSGVNLHMINWGDDRYIDHTLGYLSRRNFYYLIKEYGLEDLRDTLMIKLLKKFKKEMMDKFFTLKEQRDLEIALSFL